MADNNNIRDIYDALSRKSSGNIMPYEDFESMLISDESKRRDVYNALSKGGNMIPFDKFNEGIMGSVQQPPQQPVQPQASEAVAPVSEPVQPIQQTPQVQQPAQPQQNDTAVQTLASGGYMPRSMVPSSKEEWDEMNRQAQEVRNERQAALEAAQQKAAGIDKDAIKEKRDTAREKKNRNFFRTLGAAYASQIGGVTDLEGDIEKENWNQLKEASEQYYDNKVISDYLGDALDVINQVEKVDKKGHFNLGQGFIDDAKDLSTWDMGYSDVLNGLTIKELVEKAEAGEPLSALEQDVLDAVGFAQYVQDELGSQVGTSYKVGQSLPQSAGFMASLMLNPASGIGRQAGVAAMRKYGKKALARAARYGGDALEMGIATLTSGGGRTAAEMLEKLNGTATYDTDIEGGYNGYVGQQNQEENLWKAAWQSFASQYVENWSEAVGEYFFTFDDILRTLTNGKFKVKSIDTLEDWLQASKKEKWGSRLADFRRRTKFDGIVGEILEEEVGNMVGPFLENIGNDEYWKQVGKDLQSTMDVAGVFGDPEQARENQLVTIMSCALMCGFLNAVQSPSMKKAVDLDRRVNREAREGRKVMGEERWTELQNRIDSSTPDEMTHIIKDMMQVARTSEQAEAEIKPTLMYVLAELARQEYHSTAQQTKDEMSETKRNLINAYNTGFTASLTATPMHFRGISRDLFISRKDVEYYDATHPGANLKEITDRLVEADNATREQILQGMPSDMRELAEDYLGSYERFRGLYDGFTDAADADEMDFYDSIRPAIVDGTVTTATTADGRDVFVTSNDGKIAYIIDNETGERKEAYPADQLSTIQTVSIDELMDEYEKTVEDNWRRTLTNYTEHNEQTQQPQLGMVIGDGDETVIITDIGDGWATIQEATTDKDGNTIPKPDGKSRDVSFDYLLSLQDDIYDNRDRLEGKEIPSTLPLRREADDTVDSGMRDRIQQWSAATGVPVKVTDRVEDIDNSQVLEALSKGVKVAGWYNTSTGEVCFYIPNVKDMSEVDKTFIHEVVGHKGMRLLMGEQEYNALCGRVWNELMTDRAKAWCVSRLSNAERTQEETEIAAADEYIAYLAEQMELDPNEETRSLWERFVEMIREFLIRHNLGGDITNEDLSNMLMASLANYRKNARGEQAQTQEAPAAEEQTQQPSALASIPSSTNEKTGETDYLWSQASDVQTALDAMREAGYDDDVIRDYANDMIASLEAEAKKLGKPKAGTTMAQRQQMKADLAENERQRLFWQAVSDAMTLREQAEEEAARQQQMEAQAEQEAIDAYGSDFSDVDEALNQVIDEMDFESMVRYYAAHAKYIWADSDHGTKGFASHMFAAKGNKRGERLANIGWLANRDKGGYYPEEVAERIFADLPESIKQGHDEMETLDIIISTIQSANHPATVVRDMYAELIRKQQEAELREQQRLQEEEERQQDAYARDHGFANYQDFITFEELWASGEDIIPLSDEDIQEIDNLIAQAYGEQKQGVLPAEPGGVLEGQSGQETALGQDEGDLQLGRGQREATQGRSDLGTEQQTSATGPAVDEGAAAQGTDTVSHGAGTEQDRAQAAIDVLEEDEETAKARKFLEGTGKQWRDKPLTTLAEVKWFLNWINYNGSISKVLTDERGDRFVKYQANGSVTPNIYLGKTTPREILKQFLLYGNIMQVNIPTDIQREFDREQADAKKTSDALWADDRERVKDILTNAGIPFHDVIDSERGSRIVFTDRKNDNGNYLDYMDVSDADQAESDIESIRAKADKFKTQEENKPSEQDRAQAAIDYLEGRIMPEKPGTLPNGMRIGQAVTFYTGDAVSNRKKKGEVIGYNQRTGKYLAREKDVVWGADLRKKEDINKFRYFVYQTSDKAMTPIEGKEPANVMATIGYDYNGREIAHGIKDGDQKSIIQAATSMVEYINDGDIIVPIPSRTGRATSTLELANAIEELTHHGTTLRMGVDVVEALEGDMRESLYETKKAGNKTPKPSELGFKLTDTGKKAVESGRRIVFVDNVIATGTTAQAALQAVPNGMVLAYAQDKNAERAKEEKPGTIRFRQAIADEKTEDIFNRAIKEYGITNSSHRAGYMLPDGRYLDFSEGQGYRTLDHRNVGIAYEGTADEGWKYMYDFMSRGAIRIKPESDGFELAVKPTPEQRRTLRQFIGERDGNVMVDVLNPETDQIESAEYEDANPSMVLGEIDRFFSEGVIPQGNTMFRIYDPREGMPKVRGGWTKNKIQRYLKNNPAHSGLLWSARFIAEYDSPEAFRDAMFYHGTQYPHYGLKPSITMSERDAERYGGGGYGDRYWGISLTKDKKIASRFSMGQGVNILPVVLAKDANVIERPDFSDALDVEEHVEELWNQGVDAVWIGEGKQGKGEQELCVLNPHAISVIEHADYYRQYHLGWEDNPLTVADDSQVERIWNASREFMERYQNRPRFHGSLDWINMEPGEERDKAKEEYYKAKEEYSNSPEVREWEAFKRDMDTDIRFRVANENQAIFVSNAAKAVGSIKQEKATPDQWLAMIQKQGGIKAGEDKWLGLSEWIKTMKEMGAKTLTKQEIEEFIATNKIQIEEQRYSEAPSDYDRAAEEEYPGWNEAFYPDVYDGMAGEQLEWNIRDLAKAVELFNNNNSIALHIDIDEDGEIPDSAYDEIQDWAKQAFDELPLEERGINPTRLGYTTEGLNNKREIALWVPGIEPWNEGDNIHFGDAGEGRAIAWIRFGDKRVKREERDYKVVESFEEPTKNYKGWDIYYPVGEKFTGHSYVVYAQLKTGEMGYVPIVKNQQVGAYKSLEEARVAMNEMYKKLNIGSPLYDNILVIDEIQSKRHQEGRERGYKGQFSQTELDQAREEAHNYSNELYKKYGKPGEDFLAKATKEEKARFEELNSRVSALTRLRSSGIPDAPFDKNWQELAMKRMLRLAAEEGYDKVAWTTGEIQADRYDLGKSVRSIFAGIDQEGNRVMLIHTYEGPTIDIIHDDNGNIISHNNAIEGLDAVKNISDLVGKEIVSDALTITGKGSKNGREYKDDALRVGISGMQGFYDKMLPAFMTKYGKQWGVKPELQEFPDIYGKWWTIDVTPEMKRDVMEGQTMFRVTSDAIMEDGEIPVAFRVVDDPLLIETLEAGKKQKGYRTVAVGEDGTLGSPMAGSLGKKGSNSVKTSRFELGKWEQAEENPQMATEDGKVDLIKPNGRGSVGGVDYNPYIHIRPTSVNKQFTQAWSRPELAYIETEYPERELTSGYKANKAKLPVGRHAWNGGELILSRWDKPTRIVPWEEVADEWAKEFEDSGVTFDIVSPHMLDILANKGVKILPPKKAAGKAAMDAYKQWLGERGPEGGDKIRMRIADEALQVLDAYENGEGLGSHLDLVDSIENSDVMMEDKTLSGLVKEYRTLQEIDRLEGRRDYTGGEMDDMVEDEIIPRLRRLADGDTRFRVTPEQDVEYRKAYEEGDTEKAAQMVKDAFKAMYPDTKVVDEKGEPMVVYHGTSAKFNAFDKNWQDPGNNLGAGFYFTNDKQYAESFLGPNGDNQWRIDGAVDNWYDEHPDSNKDITEVEDIVVEELFKDARVIPAYLNITHPMLVTDADIWDEGEEMELRKRVADGIIDTGFYERFKSNIDPTLIKGATQYVAFEPNQIKSAEPFTFDDNGELIPLSERFNPENEDIRFREAEQGSLFTPEEMNGDVGNSQRNITFAGNDNSNERTQSDVQRQGDNNGAQDAGRREAATSRKAGEIIKPLRKLKEGETCLVERKMTEDKNFSFIGPDRIETSADVAYIFKELENKAVENAFLVFQGEEGTPAYVLHVGMGTISGSAVDLSPIIPMLDSIKPQKIWLVHNHPSGQIKPSRQDNGLLQAIRSLVDTYAPGVIVPPGIIIDTTRGVYGEFDGYGVDDVLYELEASDVERKAKYPVYKFDEQAFSKDYEPDNLNTIRHSGDVAKFVATHRLGERSKINILVLNTGSQVVGNFFSDVSSLDDSDDALRLARECGRYMTATDGTAIIVFGTGIPDMRINEKGKRAVNTLRQYALQMDVTLLDVQSIDSSDPNMDYPTYYSYAEHGAMEEMPEYGDVRMRVSDGVENRRENESPREFIRRMQIEYRKRFNEAVPMIVLPEQKLSKPEIKVRLGLSPYANINKVYETYEDLFKEGKVDALGWNLNTLGINKTIIFAKEDQTKVRTALTTMLHENVHAAISDSTPDERSKAAAAILQWSDGYYGKDPKDNWMRRYYSKWQSDPWTDEDNELIAYALGFDLEDGIDRQRAAEYVGGFESLRGYFDNILNKIHKEDGNREGTGRSNAGQGRVGEEGSGTSAGEVTEKETSLKQAEEATDTNPTEGQKEAGNYKHGHTRQFGMDLSIENPEGSTRSGVDPDGKKWSQVMKNTYGYIRGTMGRDKDHIDFFLGPNLNSDKVFVVDQRNVKTGAFDEHKVMLGFDNIEQARDAYNSNYDEGWQGLGDITETSLDNFKEWAFRDGRRVQPFGGNVRFRVRDEQEYERIENTLGVAAARYERAMDNMGKRLTEVMQDSMKSVDELQKAVAEESGKPIRDYENAYWAAIQYSSRNKAMQEAYHKMFYRPLMDEVVKLVRGQGDLEAAMDELNAYLLAKHGLERNEVFARRDAKKEYEEYINQHPKGTRTEDDFYLQNRRRDYSGLTALMEEKNVTAAEGLAQALVDNYEKNHDTAELWKRINAATKETLRTSVQGGVLSQEKYQELLTMFQNYVPLRGFDETTSDDIYGYYGTVNSPYNTAIKAAKGRRSLADSPLATIANIADSEIMRANRNRIYNAALNLAENHHTRLMSVSEVLYERDPQTGQWHISLPQFDKNDTPEDVAQKMAAHRTWFAQQVLADPANYRTQKEMANVPYKVISKSALSEHQVMAMRDGKQYIITINANPRAAQALAGKTNPDSSPALQWLAPFNRFLASVFTQYNPSFVLANLTRDGIYTNAMVWAKESPKYAKDYNKNWGRSLANMASLLSKYKKGTLDDNVPIERYFKEFIDNGGETGYTQLRSVKDYKKIMNRELKDVTSLSPAAAGRKVMSVIGDAVDNMNRWAEGVSRFAAYMTSREQGRSVTRSVEDAKEISVNFNKKGSGVAAMTDKDAESKLLMNVARASQLGRELFVFFNAGVQGMANAGGVVKNNPKKATALMAGLFLAGAALAMMNGGDGDDDDEKDYYNLPEYVRRSNICIKVGKHWLTIPLPIELRALYGLGELAYSVMSGNEYYEGKELAYEAASQLSQILPIDFLEGNQGTMAFIPSVAKPVVEAYWLNQDWTGAPIYNESPFNEFDPEWRKAYKSTSPALVAATRALSNMTGGNVGRPGAINLNPARIEHLFEGYLGGVGTILNQAYKTAGMAWDEDLREMRNVPIVSRFIKDADDRAAVRAENSRYHKVSDYVDEVMNEDRRLRQIIAEKEITGYDYDEEVVKDAEKRLDELRESKEWEFVQEWRALDKGRTRAREGRDEEAFNSITKQMNDLYRQYRKKK